MATSTIKYDGDTSWKSGTSPNKWVKYRRRNGIVFVTGICSGETLVGDTPITVLTLPVGYRPTEQVYSVVNNRGSHTGDGFVEVATNGEVKLRCPYATIGYYEFGISFPAN